MELRTETQSKSVQVTVQNSAPHSTSDSRSAQAVGCALLAVLLWSSSAYLGVTLAHVPTLFLIGIGLILGGSLNAIRSRGTQHSIWPLLLGTYGLLGSNLLFLLALRYAPPIEVALLNYLWPLLIVALSPVFFANKGLRLNHFLGLALGGIGAVLIVTGGRFAFSREYLLGYILACGTALVWSTYSLMAKRSSRFSSSTVSWSGLLGGAIALALHLVFDLEYHPHRNDYALLLFFGVGPLGFGYLLWDRAMRLGDARTIGSIAYLTPLLAVLVLISTGRAHLTTVVGLAMVLIVSGCFLGSTTMLWTKEIYRSLLQNGLEHRLKCSNKNKNTRFVDVRKLKNGKM